MLDVFGLSLDSSKWGERWFPTFFREKGFDISVLQGYTQQLDVMLLWSNNRTSHGFVCLHKCVLGDLAWSELGMIWA